MTHHSNSKKIHAPYNFVPLSAWIYQPDWADQVSRDVPFSDGINGEIGIRITAHSPILVGGKQQAATETEAGKVFPFKDADGNEAVPGSSIKGMTRAAMSIATFGKMRQVDDQWLSIRDLTSGVADIYRKRMTTRDLKPKVKAGYLRLNQAEGQTLWEIVPCSFLRVEHHELIRMAQGLIDNPEKIKNRQSAQEKYENWEKHLNVTFSTRNPNPNERSKKITKEHEKAHDLNRPGSPKSGQLVFTGQPQENKAGSKAKHLEFVFFDPNQAQPIPVKTEVMRAFRHIHDQTAEWKFHNEQGIHQIGIPVFYLVDEKGDRFSPTEIGLAMMFRLAYEHSIGQAIDNTNPAHREEKPHDLAELLFGHINENDAGLAGRVSFSMARLIGEAKYEKAFTTILNEPKPSYFPSYICQTHDEQGRLEVESQRSHQKSKHEKEVQIYKTLMDKDCYIRGWKRYPARADVQLVEHPGFDQFNSRHRSKARVSQQRSQDDKQNLKVQNTLKPLATGSTFVGSIRLHNVRPEELGALLWCLTWGGNPNLRHGLGMGKPLGMGQVSIEVDCQPSKLTINHGGELPDAESCIRQFETLMDRSYRAAIKEESNQQGWLESEQIVQLLAMANPHQKPPGPLKHMRLEKGNNEFLFFKGPKKESPKYALVPYVRFKGESDQLLFPPQPKPQLPKQKVFGKPKSHASSEKAKREAAAEAVRKQRLVQRLPELTGQVLLELEVEKDDEKHAKYWLEEMAKRELGDAVQIAHALRHFYQKIGKWDGKQSKKQMPKIAKIKKILAQAGGDHVPE